MQIRDNTSLKMSMFYPVKCYHMMLHLHHTGELIRLKNGNKFTQIQQFFSTNPVTVEIFMFSLCMSGFPLITRFPPDKNTLVDWLLLCVRVRVWVCDMVRHNVWFTVIGKLHHVAAVNQVWGRYFAVVAHQATSCLWFKIVMLPCW